MLANLKVYNHRAGFVDQTKALWVSWGGENSQTRCVKSPAELLRNNFHGCGWGPKRIARGSLT